MENRIYNIAAFIILILLSGCKGKTIMNQEQEFDPPKAEIKKYQHKTHNDIRVDEFYWLNNPDNPEVMHCDTFSFICIQNENVQGRNEMARSLQQ